MQALVREVHERLPRKDLQAIVECMGESKLEDLTAASNKVTDQFMVGLPDKLKQMVSRYPMQVTHMTASEP
jgi:hypothetical protein